MLFHPSQRAHTFNGIFFCLLFALSSLFLANLPWLKESGINALVLAIVLGTLYSNTLRHKLPSEWTPGIQFSAKQLLRLAIILYGFRVSFQQIASVGIEGIILDILVVTLTLLLGTFIGTKVLKLDRHTSLLIASGSAICGAAAVLAVENILKSEPYKATIAIATVVIFGTLSMFIYPLLQHLNIWGFSANQFGIFAGASIHEVAQALVAGNQISSQAGNIAVIVKMTRVLLLVPVIFFLLFFENRKTKNTHASESRLTIPWFAIGFIVAIGINSLHLLPSSVINLINQFDIFLLTMAMAAIGIETNFSKIKKVGLKPLYLALILFFWLTISVSLLVKAFT